MKRHKQILNRNSAALLIVDVQEKINSVMMHRDRVVTNIVKLIKVCKILKIFILVTEQYPRGLGATEPAILNALDGIVPLEKITFSCCGLPELIERLKNHAIKQVVVTGIESHVCVQQTALDLLANNFQVHIPKDAVSSRKELDYVTALDRMSKAGIVTTTVETVLFELLEEAGTPEFKEISSLIK